MGYSHSTQQNPKVCDRFADFLRSSLHPFWQVLNDWPSGNALFDLLPPRAPKGLTAPDTFSPTQQVYVSCNGLAYGDPSNVLNFSPRLNLSPSGHYTQFMRALCAGLACR